MALPISYVSFAEHFRSKTRQKEVDGQIHNVVESWTKEELQDYLVSVVKRPSTPPITIFVDALDEGTDEDVRALVAFLESLTQHAMAASCLLRICLSSRHYPHISLAKSLSIIVEQEVEHDQDIELYIYQKLSGREQPGISEVRRQVRDRSAGIFLWVVLVVPMLNKTFDQGRNTAIILRKLETIPPDLDNVFTQIFFHDLDDLDECITLLQRVLFTKRPLRPIELFHAVQYSCFPTDGDGRDDIVPDAIKRYLLHCSRGLIELTETDEPVIQFIHETVRSYLTDGRFLEQERLTRNLQRVSKRVFEAGNCHQKLSEVCLGYMLHSFTLVAPVNEAHLHQPLASYAAEYWWQHCQSSQLPCSEKEYELALELLNDDRGSLLSWIRLYDLDHGYPNPLKKTEELAPALYYTALIGKRELALGVLALGADVNARGFHGSALQVASERGYEQIVQILLDGGADVNAQDGYYDTALQAASKEGHVRIVQMLLDNGADVNAQEFCDTALQMASKEGHAQIVRMLLDSGALGCDAALQVASKEGHVQIVQMLLDNGAGDYNAALWTASGGGHTYIVRMLLNRGADDYNAALWTVASRGHTQIVRMLLDRGADNLNAALWAAAEGGHTQIVQILLDSGADDSSAALWTASRKGHTQTVQLLLERGARYNKAIDIRRRSQW